MLYGTTWQGGATGLGVVYQVDIKTGRETVLHNFQGGPAEGARSDAGLIRDAAGNLYGTAYFYGPKGNGAIFKVNTAGHISTLLAFNNSDGGGPKYGPMILRDGYLYGETYYGGSYGGVVYKFDLATAEETVLYNFTSADFGPLGGLTMDSAGNLYGATSAAICAPPNCGSVFKLDTSGSYTTLHSFSGGSDGSDPLGSLTMDAQGNIYGSTNDGGAVNSACQNGCGTVFQIDAAGVFTTLYAFTGGADGHGMNSGVAPGPNGILYGASEAGGAYGCGAVFSIQP
jgi:uncharacterized repeat protein (TIGR03803 family)